MTPIFHQMLQKKFNIKAISFINIGGILNSTTIWHDGTLTAKDLGPGMCLIDKWIRTKTNKKYDKNGDIAKVGKVNKNVLDKYWNIFQISDPERISYDINDFDISFAKGLSLEDGAATITELTADIISKRLSDEDTFVCGGGRKNKFLIDLIQSKIKNKILQIDNLGIDGSYIESQAFGYLAIRSFLGLPISFPETTGCKEPCKGGIIVKNF